MQMMKMRVMRVSPGPEERTPSFRMLGSVSWCCSGRDGRTNPTINATFGANGGSNEWFWDPEPNGGICIAVKPFGVQIVSTAALIATICKPKKSVTMKTENNLPISGQH
ncbi:hypothetical protein EJB05_38093, partial [Eragrostis curvula]